jgi:DNA-binding winged helix-turn-helix (wHTH) protein
VECTPDSVRFGPYEADLTTGELRRDGTRVPLQDKPFQILALLLRRPGELVTREELRAQLWPADTFVDFEHGLNTAVKKLRQALDDSADTPRFVETLPRRGYRFLGPVSGGRFAAEDASPPPAHQSTDMPGPAWPPHSAGVLVVLVAVALVANRGDRSIPGLPPNARPVIVLMDSPLEGRVYDPRTAAAGGTNADDLTDALQPLPVAIQKENTSAMWHREEQVVRQNPDLIVSHLSCLLDQRFAEPGRDGPVYEHLFTLAKNRLVAVFAYVASSNPRTRFLVYSRGAFSPPERASAFVADAETRFPALRGRVHTFDVPGGHEATFRDPETARLIRERVRRILELP